MSRRPLHLRRGRIAVVTGIVVAAALVTPTAVPSTASWSDREWAHGAVGTSSFDCGTDADYTSTASSRFLGGSIAGIDLDDVATVRGVDVAKTGAAPASVEPATAPELGTGGRPFTQAFGNPLDVGLLGDVAGIDLTGLGLGLPAGSAGAVNQVATASGTGDAVAASGLVADSGGVLVTPTTPSGDLPDPASITLGRALPGIADVTDVGLDVGAVGASAQLAGCDAISDDVWGGVVQRTLATNLRAAVQQVAADSGPTGLERDYGIASLDLRVDSPLVGALVTAVNDTVVQLDATVDALGGTDGVLARTINQGVLGVLGGLTGSLGLGTIGGTVEITGPDLAGAVAPLLAEPVQDAGGTLSLDLSAGSVRVDLAHLLGDDEHGLNDLPPNHEVVLDAVTLGALADRLGQVVDAWAGKITTALTTALGSLHVRIALAADLSAPLVLGIRVKIATLSIGVDTGVAALMAGQTKLSVGVALLGLDLGGLLGVVTGLATSLVNPLTQAVVGALTTRLFALVGTLGTTLTTTIGGPVVRALGTVLARLPGVLSLRVNVQQDLAAAPTPAGRATTGQYTQTALRLSIADALVPGGLARVDLASAVVGPNSVSLLDAARARDR
ncbi:choice-of-anchor G family protein [Curtobacterium sp. VKM Ac-2861]|uniref:choice-of-anchor G family protein n=1 Tax=Curtobacterium sp. VKM Ac-2861 TaxID=2739016 RepID=UPI00156619BD|nr:choice-of-anchor G family protein [Curtobacterium sp. VKM Ac-2861]